MTNDATTIENMMKVSLKIQTGEASTDEKTGTSFEFIFGVGPAGITPFEKALFGRRTGDQIHFDIASADYCETVGHLRPALREQTGIISPDRLLVTIDGIARAKDREVVKAMATGGGCGDCDCGCGGH